MIKADKMLLDLGCKPIKIGNCIELGFESGNTVNLWCSDKTIDSDFTEMPISVWVAIHEKIKELGWIKPTEVLEEYQDYLEDLEFTHEDLCE